ncbi:MAG: type II 3-dehydroquinate dehydratase [Oligoflexales bacterium]|nr:type II 3-dehydroquinate dehydratase [Oligoflexales bacterium]
MGTRQPELYGSENLLALERFLSSRALSFEQIGLGSCSLSFFQSNNEAEFLSILSQGWDGVLLNAGAWTHTSLALADRLLGLQVPFIEVHLSNLAKRESFRKRSYAAPHARAVVHGAGFDSYAMGLYGLLSHLSSVFL